MLLSQLLQLCLCVFYLFHVSHSTIYIACFVSLIFLLFGTV